MDDPTRTKVRLTITDNLGEVYVGPCALLIDENEQLWIEDDNNDLTTPTQILLDAWGWAGSES